jgi:putative chitinase
VRTWQPTQAGRIAKTLRDAVEYAPKQYRPREVPRMALTLEQLQALAPKVPASRLGEYLAPLNDAMHTHGISMALPRMEMFLAQLLHESGGLQWMEELASGQEYEGRRDLGNTHPGDGRRFKGRGPIQITGRSNYERYGHRLSVDLIAHPERAADPEYAFEIAALYWSDHHLNAVADRDDLAAFEAVTKAINGGLNGLENRRTWWARVKRVLGDRT